MRPDSPARPGRRETSATAQPAPTVPDTGGDTDEVALSGEHDSPADDSDEQQVVQAVGAPSAGQAGQP